MKVRPASIKDNQVDPVFDGEGRQVSSGIDGSGREIPDGVPMSPPVGYEAPSTLEQIVERLVRSRELAAVAEAAGEETFDEADDFDVEDEDYDPRFPESIYEAYFEAKSRRKAAAAASRQVEPSRTTSVGSASASSPASSAERPSASDVAVSDPDSGRKEDPSARAPEVGSSRK